MGKRGKRSGIPDNSLAPWFVNCQKTSIWSGGVIPLTVFTGIDMISPIGDDTMEPGYG